MSQEELNGIWEEWATHLEEFSGLAAMDPEIRRRLKSQIERVRSRIRQPKESVFEVWRRVATQLHDGKTPILVDLHVVNVYMKEQEEMRDGAKGTQTDSSIRSNPIGARRPSP